MRVYFRENKIGKVNGKVDLLPQCSKPISKCNLKEVHVELQIFQYWKETMQSSLEKFASIINFKEVDLEPSSLKSIEGPVHVCA